MSWHVLRALAGLLLLAAAAGWIGCAPHRAASIPERASGMTLTKETQGPEVTIALRVPQLRVELEETLTVRLRGRETGAPVSGAHVSVLIGQLESQPIGPSAEGMTDMIRLEAREAGQAGLYHVTHRFQAAGPHEVMAEATPGEPGAGWTRIVVEARPIVLGR
jgi:hypothetical protein